MCCWGLCLCQPHPLFTLWFGCVCTSGAAFVHTSGSVSMFNCRRFAIRPEAFKAEGWLPDPPASYLEALRRQQRLLHGQERRRCLHQHKVRCLAS